MEALCSPYSTCTSCLTLELNVCIINQHAASEVGTSHDFCAHCLLVCFHSHQPALASDGRVWLRSLLPVPLGAAPGTRDWQGQRPIWDNIEWDPSSVQEFSLQLSQLLVVDAACDCTSYRCLRLHPGVLPFPVSPLPYMFFEEYLLVNHFYTDPTSGSVLGELNWRHVLHITIFFHVNGYLHF